MKMCPKCESSYPDSKTQCYLCKVSLVEKEGGEMVAVAKKVAAPSVEETAKDIRVIKNILVYFAALTTIGLILGIVASVNLMSAFG